MADPELYPPVLTPVHLTDQERRVVFRSLELTCTVMDVFGEPTSLVRELAERMDPGSVL